jgi:tetratricopeptide (TPR) repeat protein
LRLIKNFVNTRSLRAVAALALLFLCALAMRSAWRAGAGRLRAKEATRALLKEQAEKAVAVSPADPETHSALAAALYNAGDLPGTLGALERAASLRPRDYLLWLQLGRVRDEAGDHEGALLAMREAVRLAPYYSEPRWQYGNVFYRAGRFDEAFRELRRAAESDPALFPVLTDLAWGTYKGDVRAVEEIVNPQTDALRLSLARFFVKKGKITEALSLFRAAAGISGEEQRKLLAELIKNKQFKAAYEVWDAGGGAEPGRRPGGPAGLTDPGFEGRINLSEAGYGWRQERSLEGVRLSLETKGPKSGSRCLLIEWSGHSQPESPVVSQLVLVEPNTRYRLSFFTRTEEVVTGGPPVLVVTDAGDDEARVLGQSQAFPRATNGWQEYETVFTTPGTAEAVLISVRRQSCQTDPCPVFGRVWLDDFTLSRSKPE